MIPVYKPTIGDTEKRYVNEALDSTWISSKGAFIDRFEREFAQIVDAKHAVSACNGTVSLHLALEVAGVGPGDEVIVPTLTYVASVNAIAYTGATPVFVDSEPEYGNLDPALLEAAITERTKAIEVVHLYGHPADMDPILEIAARHGLAVIEDAAEAHGAEYKGRRVGAIGEVGSFSFFGNKVVTTGEGGVLVTNDPELAEKARHLRGQGVSPTRTYWHDVLGYNYRMTNICAALGCAQLERFDEVVATKRELGGWYREELADVEGVRVLGEAEWAKSVFWMDSIVVEPELRDPLMEHLKGAGIETRPFFHPAHTLPMYETAGPFPVAERLGSGGINLPSWPGLTREQVGEICGAVREFLGKSQA
jgi:perosamine synthetase